MPALARLKRRSEFLRVAGKGRKWVTPGLILQAMPRAEENISEPRIGFTASRAVGIAVARNRARRRLRAAAEAVLPSHAMPGRDYVMIARAGTLTRPYAELLGDLESALRRLGAWREAS